MIYELQNTDGVSQMLIETNAPSKIVQKVWTGVYLQYLVGDDEVAQVETGIENAGYTAERVFIKIITP